MMGVQGLLVKVLFLVIVCLLGLQYLSLLQVDEKGRHIRSRSLFTLDWSGGSGGSDATKSSSNARLLSNIEHFLDNAISEEAEGSAWNKTLSLLPPTVTTLSSIPPIPSSTQRMTATTTAKKGNSSILPTCPMIPPGLRGPIKVTLPSEVPSSMEEIESQFPDLLPGGRSMPRNCTARHRVAIIVPYRDRELHLRTFLLNIHSFLSRQMLDYGVFIVEQFGSASDPFNRAMLLNVGAAEAVRQHDYTCFIFHDIDLLPEDDRNLYTCPVQPRHLSVAIDSFLYRLPYDDIFGGVSAMSVDHFRLVNGFSNVFWGWGGEDDDMSNRLRQKKLYISRYPANVARYKMLKHSKGKANPDRFKNLYSGAKRMGKDGYNSLRYRKVQLKLKKLYTWILVDLAHLKH